MHFSMIHSLYLVYKACKYGILNGSLFLVCKSPDSSKPEKENEGEEEGGESNKGRGSRRAKCENENNVWLRKTGEWFFWSGRGEACYLLPPHPWPRTTSVQVCWSIEGTICLLGPWKLCHKSDLPFQAVETGPEHEEASSPHFERPGFSRKGAHSWRCRGL